MYLLLLKDSYNCTVFNMKMGKKKKVKKKKVEQIRSCVSYPTNIDLYGKISVVKDSRM